MFCLFLVCMFLFVLLVFFLLKMFFFGVVSWKQIGYSFNYFDIMKVPQCRGNNIYGGTYLNDSIESLSSWIYGWSILTMSDFVASGGEG